MKLIELEWGISRFICTHFGLICDLFILCDPPRWTPLMPISYTRDVRFECSFSWKENFLQILSIVCRLFLIIRRQRNWMFTSTYFLVAACSYSGDGFSSPFKEHGTFECSNSSARCSLFGCQRAYNLLGDAVSWCRGSTWVPPPGRCVWDPRCKYTLSIFYQICFIRQRFSYLICQEVFHSQCSESNPGRDLRSVRGTLVMSMGTSGPMWGTPWSCLTRSSLGEVPPGPLLRGPVWGKYPLVMS